MEAKSCRHCGNTRDDTAILQCSNGHVYCNDCELPYRTDGGTCPYGNCKEYGGHQIGFICNDDDDSSSYSSSLDYDYAIPRPKTEKEIQLEGIQKKERKTQNLIKVIFSLIGLTIFIGLIGVDNFLLILKIIGAFLFLGLLSMLFSG